MNGPLAGVKVLDLSVLYPGAFCSLLLADLGAEVVKVERPGAGDGMRMLAAPGTFNAAHTALNRGKRSVTLDVRNEAAGDVLGPLARWADVVIESNRPGQLDELGLGYDALRAENPALVWCSITGFGTTGPNALAGGHDLTFLGTSALLAKLADGDPTPPATTISLPLAGSLAATGLLAALLAASRTGEGRRLEVAMTEAAAWVLSEDVAREANAPAPGWGAFSARNTYRCADGRWVTVAATEPRTWAALCEGLDAPDLAAHQIGQDEPSAIERLAATFATRAMADWVERPGLAGGVGPVLEPADLLTDPSLTARGGLVDLDGGAGTVLAGPIRWDGPDGAASTIGRSAPPDLGADTDEVLAAAGLGAEEIGALRATGALG